MHVHVHIISGLRFRWWIDAKPYLIPGNSIEFTARGMLLFTKIIPSSSNRDEAFLLICSICIVNHKMAVMKFQDAYQ